MFASLMLKLNQNYEVDQRNSKSEYIGFSPADTTIDTTKIQIFLNIPRKGSYISLLS